MYFTPLAIVAIGLIIFAAYRHTVTGRKFWKWRILPSNMLPYYDECDRLLRKCDNFTFVKMWADKIDSILQALQKEYTLYSKNNLFGKGRDYICEVVIKKNTDSKTVKIFSALMVCYVSPNFVLSPDQEERRAYYQIKLEPLLFLSKNLSNIPPLFFDGFETTPKKIQEDLDHCKRALGLVE